MSSRVAPAACLLLLTTLLASCSSAPKFRYEAQKFTRNTPPGKPGATYPTPTGQKGLEQEGQGFIRIDSQGFRRADLPSGRRSVAVIELHLVLSNRDPIDWQVKPEDFRLRITKSADALTPVLITADREGLPYVRVPANETRVVLVDFEVPGKTNDEALPHFEFFWRAEAGDRRMSDWLAFERVEIPPGEREDAISGPGSSNWWPYASAAYGWGS